MNSVFPVSVCARYVHGKASSSKSMAVSIPPQISGSVHIARSPKILREYL